MQQRFEADIMSFVWIWWTPNERQSAVFIFFAHFLMDARGCFDWLCAFSLSLSFYTVLCALYAKLLKLLFHLSPSADESCACALRAQEQQRADYAETSCTTQRERCFFRRALKSLFETRRSINMLSMFEGEVAEFKVTSKYLS